MKNVCCNGDILLLQFRRFRCNIFHFFHNFKCIGIRYWHLEKMNNKGDLLDELHKVRDSFVPVTHFLTERKLRDENKELFCIRKSPSCFHLIGECSLAYPVEFLQSTSYFRSLVGFLWKRKKRSQYYSSKDLQRVNKTSCFQLNLTPFH